MPASAGLFPFRARPSSARPGRYRCLVNTTGIPARRACSTARAALRTASSAPSSPMPIRLNEPSGWQKPFCMSTTSSARFMFPTVIGRCVG